MTFQDAPVVKAQMLIRRPANEVYQAFTDPTITSRFWFTGSSGHLESGKALRWDWDMYGVSAQVLVREMEQDRRILIEWGEPPCPVEWIFVERPGNTTLVTISSWGFTGNDDEIIAKALDSMGGFTSVLAGLKALLEHNVVLNLVADHNPDAHRSAQP